MQVNRQLVNLWGGGGGDTERKLYFKKMIHKNFVVLDEKCHWLKLMYLFLRHVVYFKS
jgi:hypothetical protein